MVIKGLERDLNEDKGMIDAEGFNIEREHQSTTNECDNCGRLIKEGENAIVINGEHICENCTREA